MSQETITITKCDGCGRDDYHDGVDIVEEQKFGLAHPGNWTHICRDCVEGGLYICRPCHDVHSREANKDHLAAVRAADDEMGF